MNKQLVNKLKAAKSIEALQAFLRENPSARRSLDSEFQAVSAQADFESGLKKTNIRKRDFPDPEWFRDLSVSFFDRWEYFKANPVPNDENSLWNLYLLGRILNLVSGLYSLAIRLMDYTLERAHHLLTPEIKHRLMAVKTLAFRQLMMNDPFKYAEKSLDLCLRTMQYDFKASDFELWTKLQWALATILQMQVKGNHAENLERSLECAEVLLKEQENAGRCPMLIPTHICLGNAYERRINGNIAENYEHSIFHHTKASHFCDPLSQPDLWAVIQNNLGLVYRKRIRGDKGENLELSIQYLKAALDIHIKTGNTLHTAQTMTNLGVSYNERIFGNRASNLHSAITYYRKAIRLMKSAPFAGYKAWALHNLAVAYFHLPRTRKAVHIEKAIRCYEEALQFRKPETAPRDWLVTIINLGLAYAEREKGDFEKNVAHAILLMKSAFRFARPKALEFEWARIHKHLGMIYSTPEFWNIPSSLKRSIRHLKIARQVFLPDTLPFESRHLNFQLGKVLFRRRRYTESIAAFTAAVEADVHRHQQMFLTVSRTSEIETGSSIYYCLAYVLSKRGRCEEALKWLEKGKTRILSEQFLLDRAEFSKLSEKDRNRYQGLVDRLQALQIEQYMPGRDLAEIIRDTRENRKELDQLVKDLRSVNPGFLDHEIQYDHFISELPEGTALLEYGVTDFGTVIFFIFSKSGKIKINSHLNPDFTCTDLTDLTNRWVKRRKRASRISSDTHISESWGWYVQKSMKRLSIPLIEPVMSTIQKHRVRQLVLVPHLSLHLFPLHLMGFKQEGRYRLLMEEYDVSYLPSLAIAAICRSKTGSSSRSFAAVSDPTLDLPWCRKEIEQIAAMFRPADTRILSGKQAKPDAVKSAIETAGYVHFACHSRFNRDEPYRSFIALSREDSPASPTAAENVRVISHSIQSEPLLLSDIFTELKLTGNPLVVLSSCESGTLTQSGTSDEYIGFPAGFLYSGARAVVSSLWNVDDRATSLLMTEFYRNILEKKMPADQALRSAQLHLKSTDEFSNPFFWASFIFSGVLE